MTKKKNEKKSINESLVSSIQNHQYHISHTQSSKKRFFDHDYIKLE